MVWLSSGTHCVFRFPEQRDSLPLGWRGSHCETIRIAQSVPATYWGGDPLIRMQRVFAEPENGSPVARKRGEDILSDKSSERPDQTVVPPPPYSKETEDERFLQSTMDELEERGLLRGGQESWRVFRILGEFVDGFEELSSLGPCVSFFGSARLTEADPVY